MGKKLFKPRQLFSIRSRIIGVQVGLVLFPLILLGVFLGKEAEKNLNDNTHGARKDWLQWLNRDLTEHMEHLRMEASYAAEFPPISGLLRSRDAGGRDPLDGSSHAEWTTRLQQLFLACARTHPDYTQILYLDETGQEWVRIDSVNGAASAVEAMELQDKSRRPYFEETIRLPEGQWYVSLLNLNVEHGKIQADNPVLRVAVPVWFEGRPRGVVVINESPLALLSKLETEGQGRLILADAEGTYLFHPDESMRWGKQLGHEHNIYKDWPGLRKAQEAGTRLEEKGDSVLLWNRVALNPHDPSNAWILGFEWGRSEFYEAGERVRLLVANTAFGWGLVTLLLAVLTASALTKPIIRTAKAASLLGAGDFSVRLPEGRGGEFGEVARAFNLMAQTVGNQTESLKKKTIALEAEIEERKRVEKEQKRLHREFIKTSRQAGKAEVATGILHNVGNVLNSVNVSATVIREKIERSRLNGLTKAVNLLDDHGDDLSSFFQEDPKGRRLPAYLKQATDFMNSEHVEIIEELATLTSSIDHIKRIVNMQQSFARISGVAETVFMEDLLEEALLIDSASLERHNVKVVREYGKVAPLEIDKQKVLQILVNLISNAKHAVKDCKTESGALIIRAEENNGRLVRAQVKDNGMGIASENLAKIFSHGFTTKKNGHGFGLHSSALAAKELGGSLSVHSDGLGRGATFTLELVRGTKEAKA